MGVARTPRIFRQPAMAIWVWSRISLSSAIGSSSRFTRNRNATSSPKPRPHAGPWIAPTDTTVARDERAEEVGEREHHREPLGRAHLRPVLRVDGVVEAAPAASLQPVGLHHRRAGHQLGHLRQRAADRGADVVVGGQLAALQVAAAPGCSGRNTSTLTSASCHEYTSITRHRADDQHGVDDPRHRAPLGELRHRLDVARHARHERAAALVDVVGERQAVDVLEGAHAQPEQAGLRGAHEAQERGPADEVEHDGEHRGEGAGGGDEAGSVAVVAEHAAAEDLLDQDRDGQLAGGGAHREHDGEHEALLAARG